MADKSTQLILDALSLAATYPDGIPLHGNKKSLGLFPNTSAAKQAAQRCKERGFVQVIDRVSKGRNTQEVCTLTEKGMEFLLAEANPKHVLEDLVRILESRQSNLEEMTTTLKQIAAGVSQEHQALQALRETAEAVLIKLPKPQVSGYTLPECHTGANGKQSGDAEVLKQLFYWKETGFSEDCPLPELYRNTQKNKPGLSIGRFQDQLRRFHEMEKIYLHPWTGPLYDIPEPQFCLLIGHEVLYYASLRVSSSELRIAE